MSYFLLNLEKSASIEHYFKCIKAGKLESDTEIPLIVSRLHIQYVKHSEQLLNTNVRLTILIKNMGIKFDTKSHIQNITLQTEYIEMHKFIFIPH